MTSSPHVSPWRRVTPDGLDEVTTSPTPKLLLSAREAAHALGVSERTLWTYSMPRGPIPAVNIGSRRMYSTESLRRWIADREKGGAQ